MSSPVRIPDGFVDELKARIRPSDVIGRKVKLTKKGKAAKGTKRSFGTSAVAGPDGTFSKAVKLKKAAAGKEPQET